MPLNFFSRLGKAIRAFATAFRNDMSFEENSVYARTEVLSAVKQNDKAVKILEQHAITIGSLQWNMMDGFLRKCLEKTFAPGILEIYKEQKAIIPGLHLDVQNSSDIGNGRLTQKITVYLHGKVVGKAEITSFMQNNKVFAKLEEVEAK